MRSQTYRLSPCFITCAPIISTVAAPRRPASRTALATAGRSGSSNAIGASPTGRTRSRPTKFRRPLFGWVRSRPRSNPWYLLAIGRSCVCSCAARGCRPVPAGQRAFYHLDRPQPRTVSLPGGLEAVAIFPPAPRSSPREFGIIHGTSELRSPMKGTCHEKIHDGAAGGGRRTGPAGGRVVRSSPAGSPRSSTTDVRSGRPARPVRGDSHAGIARRVGT